MNLRSFIFWSKDFLFGGNIKHFLNEIIKINEYSTPIQIDNFQRQQIKALLSEVCQNVNYYKPYANTEFNDLPVIDKNVIKNNNSDFISAKYDKRNLVTVRTSGSTGTPFISYQSKYKKKRNTADVIYFGKCIGFKLGTPLLYLKIWSANNKRSRLKFWQQNIIPVDVIKMGQEKLMKILEIIENNSNININGYASALEELCKYVENKDLQNKEFHVNSIIAQSESLPLYTKNRLKKYFNCVPVSRYSNVENGVIAQQLKNSDENFLINNASYLLELLKLEEDKPAKKGEYGRIVVTDLFNDAMPFIRYDTGDIGKFFINDNGEVNIKYLSDIQGRKLDILLDTQGNIISSFIMYKNMFKYPEINQFQLIQKNKKDYKFIVSIDGNFDRENELREEFVSILGNDANFIIEYIDEIPLLNSGKRRKIINEYLNIENK